MSEKFRVLVTRKLPDAVEARLENDYEAHFNPTDRLYSSEELIKLSEGMNAIVLCHTEKMTAEIIDKLPESVQALVNFSVGYDHVDVAAAKKKGLIVTNTPDVLSDATAEIAMVLMLGAARRVSEGERLVRSQEWKDWSPAFMVGTQMTGKRLGVIGMGRVGQVVAKRAKGFDMEIHYHNRRELSESEFPGAVYHDTIEDLLPHCDFLSLHCPSTPETQNLLNESRLGLMPRGAIVINTSRGGIIDDESLISALESGHIRAAGLDVFNGEPENIHPRYRELENVFLLPHIGSATAETRAAMGFRALDNLDAIKAGNAPGDRVG